jgi:alanine racemase
MDQAMIDITGTDAQVGDIVEIFGDRLPIAELAQKLGTIPYEVLTSISHRVQRVYFYE